MSRTRRVRLTGFCAACLVSALYVWSRYEVDLTGFYQDMSYGWDIPGGGSNDTTGTYVESSEDAARTVVETEHINDLQTKTTERGTSKSISAPRNDSKVENYETRTVIQDETFNNVKEPDIYNGTQGSDTNQTNINQTVITRKESAEEIDTQTLSYSTEEEAFPNKTSRHACSPIPDHLVGRLRFSLKKRLGRT